MLKHILLIIIAILLVFSNSLFNDFVYDDFDLIVKNDDIKSLSGILKLFNFAFNPLIVHIKDPFPITFFTFFIDYSIWGLNPFGFHFTNIFLHILNSILVYVLVIILLRNFFSFEEDKMNKIAVLVALFFALHPCKVECVCWVSGRKDLLSAFFVFISFYFFMKFLKNYNYFFYIISVSSFVFSLLSKSNTIAFSIMIPIFLFLNSKIKNMSNFRMDIIESNRKRNKGCNEERVLVKVMLHSIPFFFVSLYVLFINYKSGLERQIVKSLWEGNLFTHILTFFSTPLSYLKLFIFPINLSIVYPYNPVKNLFDLRFISAFIIYLFILFVLIVGLKIKAFESKINYYFMTFLILFFIFSIIPTIGIVPTSTLIADRYLYFPSFSLCFLFVFFLYKIKHFFNKKTVNLVIHFFIISVLIFYSTVCYSRNYDWKDGISLWKSALKYQPNNFFVHNNLGVSYFREGNLENAIKEFYTALRFSPDNKGIILNIASVHSIKGEWKLANEFFLKAYLLSEKKSVGLIYELAYSYLMLGDYKNAVKFFTEVKKMGIDSIEISGNLAISLYKSGDFKSAEKEFNVLIKKYPKSEKLKFWIKEIKSKK